MELGGYDDDDGKGVFGKGIFVQWEGEYLGTIIVNKVFWRKDLIRDCNKVRKESCENDFSKIWNRKYKGLEIPWRGVGVSQGQI